MKYYLVANNYIWGVMWHLNKIFLNSPNTIQYIDGNISEIYDLKKTPLFSFLFLWKNSMIIILLIIKQLIKILLSRYLYQNVGNL